MRLRTAVVPLCLVLGTTLGGCTQPSDDAGTAPLARTCDRDGKKIGQLLLPVPRDSGALGDYPVNQQPNLADYLDDQYDDAASRKDVRGELRSRDLEKIAIRTWEDPDHNITQVVMLQFGSEEAAEDWADWESGTWENNESRRSFEVQGWSDAHGWRDTTPNDAGEISSDVVTHAGPIMINIRYWTPDRFNNAYVQRITDAQLTRLEC